ncbi:chord-domain-containing protein [Cutaneotrichosporon oleaginosum]|uniref:Chord-domain-containing protein n=1 Tax=Cutaneotrichosporon oleaginosum TaxID=879819 RepID=A0A0J1B2K1_9TREE|nr:chord-domain-containing protein [Cutaneotrichosporon oleaginosum]KLT41829.1 chord-domain-containing protein [Cutaneotrichosporon oleaginosum]TXT14750.1 hypothetical protein COLE_00943 [Cutaneotrichosporon oleaginosum]
MPRCTNKGCGKEYDESSNADDACAYHPGGPVFHEGLKSWSCCNETSKPVMEFDQFMAIPPCARGRHTDSKAEVPAPAAPVAEAPKTTAGGVEVYGSARPAPAEVPESAIAPAAPPTPAPVEEEDDESLPVPDGAKCKRFGCGAAWRGAAASRGDGPDAVCTYHPQKPVFHEGSKGYLCCKPRVLEFDQFLKIPGCKTGRHLFVGAPASEERGEELVDCRVDHYQTPMEVHVSAYAKGADKERSSVSFAGQSITLDLYLPGNKRVQRTLTLYGPIVPDKCRARILGTKVDITLIKPVAASWPLLELPPAGTELPPGYALTFGVSGRTGTVGGKEVVLSVEEAARR